MLTILNENQAKKFIESLNKELKALKYYDYCFEEEITYSDKYKYIGWNVNGEIKCAAVIIEIENKYVFMKELNERIIQVLVNFEVNYDFVKPLLSKMAQKFPNTALQSNDLVSYENYEESYYSLDLKDPYKLDEYDYFGVRLEDDVLISKFNSTDFENKFNDEIKPAETESLEYKLLNQKELREIMMTDHFWNTYIVGGNSRFLGFHYFSADHLNRYTQPENSRFLVCIANKKNVVGVIKIADYSSGNLTYSGLNYTDVHSAYRRKGIARNMYKHLNETLDKNTLLISSSLSEMGYDTRIDLVRKECLTSIENFDSLRNYYESKSNAS